MKLRAPQEKKTPYEYFMFHIWRYQLSVKKDTLPLPMAVLYTSQSSQVLNGPQRHSLEFVPLLRRSAARRQIGRYTGSDSQKRQ
jgi:hypothetical protein